MRPEDGIVPPTPERGARRRRLTVVAGSVAAMVLALVAVAVTAGDGDDGRSVTADGGIGSAEETTTTTRSTVLAPDSLDGDGSTATTEAPSATTIHEEPDPETSGEPRPDESGTAEATTTTSTTTSTTAPPPLCPESAIHMVVATDRSTYPSGEEVVMTAEGTNRAGHDCAEADSSETVIRDQDGRHVYGVASIAGRTEGDWRWPAGEARRSEERWSQESVTEEGREPVPPGSYTVTMSWSAADPETGERVAYSGSATFTIEAP